jgi:hypothetical protein
MSVNNRRVLHPALAGEPGYMRAARHHRRGRPTFSRETANYNQPLGAPGWLVQSDEQLQLVGSPLTAPAPPGQTVTATPPEPFEGTCSAVMDANSGDWTGRRDNPW